MKKRSLKKLWLLIFSLALSPLTLSKVLYAGSDIPLISLDNTNFVVLIAFIAFIALMLYLKVPVKINILLDDRSKLISDELDNATSILEESKTILAELEREHKTNIEKAEQIVLDAEIEAKRILNDAKKEVRWSIERKIRLAEDQIKATEASVIKSIKDKSIDKAIETAEIQLVQSTNSNLRNTILKDSLKDLDSGLKQLNL